MGEHRGFNLLEITVSMTLVALLISFVVSIFPNSIQMFRAGREMTAAEDALRNVIEEIRGQGFDRLVDGSVLSGSYTDQQIAEYAYTVDIADVAGYSGRLKELTIHMTWSTRAKTREIVRHVRVVNVQK